MKRTYTTEEREKIVAGLLKGPAKRKPMSEAEWHNRFDTTTPHEERMEKIFTEIKEEIAFGHDQVQPRFVETRRPTPAPAAPTPPPNKTLPL